MKKFYQLILSLLAIFAFSSLSSCTKEVKFNFDDKYFIGMQEHFYEIRNMEPMVTTDFICDLNEVVGSKVFRLNVTLNKLFYVDNNDTVKFNESVKQEMRRIVNKLKDSGVERIVYATDTFIYPYDYSYSHSQCVPDPLYEKSQYIRWLNVMASAYELMATEFPEIKYFEPINEPDIDNNETICKNGMIWGTKNSDFMYSAKEEAHILADLCFYIRKAIKKVNKNNMMTTAAFATLDESLDYLEYFYQAIESGMHPIGDDLACSVDPDDYFDIVNLHPYSSIAYNANPTPETKNGVVLMNNDYIKGCKMFYDVCCKHGDAEKPHWYTESGYTDQGKTAIQSLIGEQTAIQLSLIKKELPFVECVIFYKMTDHCEYQIDDNEKCFGLFTAVALSTNPLEAKPIMLAIYSFMNGGTKDYTQFYTKLDTLRNKYVGGN